MTLVVGWVSLDYKKEGKFVASIYFASDSRYMYISNSGKTTLVDDTGQKVFGCNNSPNIFAFCGEVNCPKTLITKAVKENR